MIRKPAPGDLEGKEFTPQRVIRLDARQFRDFVNNPQKSRPEWFDHRFVLIECPELNALVAVNTEGADYARYAARIR